MAIAAMHIWGMYIPLPAALIRIDEETRHYTQAMTGDAAKKLQEQAKIP